jgi:hypothetical protein
MTGALLFVALCLGSYRLWRLIGKDDITQPARDVLAKETAGTVRRYLLLLVSCSFCAGTWISLAVVYAVHRWWSHLDLWLLWAVAVAGVVGLLGMIDDKLSE